jgi:hypothetical protein
VAIAAGPELLVPERDRRFDAHCATCGQPAREEDDDEQCRRSDDVRPAIEAADSIQAGFEDPAQPGTGEKAR